MKKKILFLGETYRADAITWMKGLEEFGDFEIITWELKTSSNSFFKRIIRLSEYFLAVLQIKKTIKKHQPDMVIAERTTSYGFLAAISGVQPSAIAQQGRTDLWPENSLLLPIKKVLQNYAFKKADLIHAWGSVMAISMVKSKVDMEKVMVLPKGINLDIFNNDIAATSTTIDAIVTRSLLPEYRHDIILKAFAQLNQKQIDFKLTIVGDGKLLEDLKKLASCLGISNKVSFTGKIPNSQLPLLLQQSNIYISMPITEGVSASLFEAMATHCYPIVSDVPGNQCWINHGQNGHLVPIDDVNLLSKSIIESFENEQLRKTAIQKNRKFVEENANYQINMKKIAQKYHELINLKRN